MTRHNGDFPTTYENIRTLLVSEEQFVSQGENIAQMGGANSDRVTLHFELRYQGYAFNPSHAQSTH